MNRRDFLTCAALIAAALVTDPEQLLWVPGKKKIFVPKPPAIEEICHLFMYDGTLIIGEVTCHSDVFRRWEFFL